ncbi:MAG: hypothetical protein HQ512_02915 [Rhodospirillales bacterium]|nr:hypothetical protein [Rhodospirillales bacterium]
MNPNLPVYPTLFSRRKVEGDGVLRVKQGDMVSLSWATDEAVDLHLHGYDIKQKVGPGKMVNMAFIARATGRFAVSAHGFGDSHEHGLLKSRETTLIYLEVHPR